MRSKPASTAEDMPSHVLQRLPELPSLSASDRKVLSEWWRGTTMVLHRMDEKIRTIESTVTAAPTTTSTTTVSSQTPITTQALMPEADWEPNLGKPSASGYVLTSTKAGARSWVSATTFFTAGWPCGTEDEREILVPSPVHGKSFYVQIGDGTLPEGPQFYADGVWIPFGARKASDGKWWYNGVSEPGGRVEFGPVCVS